MTASPIPAIAAVKITQSTVTAPDSDFQNLFKLFKYIMNAFVIRLLVKCKILFAPFSPNSSYKILQKDVRNGARNFLGG